MNSRRQRLAEITTERLASHPEIRGQAQDQVLQHLESLNAKDEDLQEVIEEFGRTDGTWLLRNWKVILYSIVGLLFLVAAIEARMIKVQWRTIKLITDNSYEELPIPQNDKRSIRDRLLLYGMAGADSSAERWKPLWENNPSNRAYFAKYFQAVLEDKGQIPQEILELADQVDPENGYYLTVAAGTKLKEAIKHDRLTEEEREAIAAISYEIIDEESYLEGISLLRKAGKKTRFQSYSKELLQAQLKALEPVEDYFSFVATAAFVAGTPSLDTIKIMATSHGLSMEAEQSAASGNEEALLSVFSRWDSLMRNLCNDGHDLIDVLVAKSLIGSSAANLRDAAAARGLNDQAEYYTKIATWNYENRKSREDKRSVQSQAQFYDLLNSKGSIFTELSLPMVHRMVSTPPEISEEELAPARLSEYSFLLQIVVGIGCTILLLIAGLIAFRITSGSLLNRYVSLRLVDRLPPKAWLKLFSVCGIVPVSLFLGLLYATPFSFRDWGIRPIGFLQVPLMGAGLLILMLSLAYTISSWLCDHYLDFALEQSGRPKRRWWISGMALAGFLLSSTLSFLLFEGEMRTLVVLAVSWTSTLLLTIPLCAMTYQLAKPLIGKKDLNSRFATSLRMMVPSVFVQILLLAALIPLFRIEEGHWMKKDQLMKPSAEKPAITSYEWEVTQIMKRELLTVLENPS